MRLMTEKQLSWIKRNNGVFMIIKEHFILLVGVGLFTYNLFNFDTDRYCNTDGKLKALRVCSNPSAYHYYEDTVLTLLTIGAILIVIGLLKIKRTK
jgi:hypothetical protein